MEERAVIKRKDGTEEEFPGGREFVGAVAGASSKEALRDILNGAGISGFDEEQLEAGYKNLALSQDWDAVLAMLKDQDYESRRKRLQDYGIELPKEESDLIDELAASAADEELVEQLRSKQDIGSVMALLHSYGYHAITEEFLMLVHENALHFYEDALLTPEDMEIFSGRDFYERCRKSINLVFALSTIAGLALGVEGVAEPAFLIAVASGMSLIIGQDGQEKNQDE